MKLVQRHLIKFNKNEFLAFDKLAFLSKNLYNCAVYLGFAERSYNLYWKRLLARLRVAQVQGNLLKSLKTLASSLISANVP